MSPAELAAASPLIITATGACLVLLLEVLGFSSLIRNFVVICTFVLCLLTSFRLGDFNDVVFSGSLFSDSLTMIYFAAISLAGLFTYLISFKALKGEGVTSGAETDSLFLFSTAGALLLVSAANFITLFVGFELLSLSVYALSGSALKQKASSESAMKYFIMGSFSSAFLLYGLALIYGATGFISYAEIAAVIPSIRSQLIILGVLLIMFGFSFKVSLVPFHVWTPDVYQGAPTSVTAFMAVVVKLAAFGAFLRLFSYCFSDPILFESWSKVGWLLAVLSMTVGNVLAIQQKSIKRMLAYSSIAHAGYVFIGFLALGQNGGGEAATYYLLAYSFMSIASFGLVSLISNNTKEQYDMDSIASYRGLGEKKPLYALLLTIVLIALSGMPPLIGFIGKFFLFTVAHEAGYTGLAIVAAINSVISLYYYLNIIVQMYFTKDENASAKSELGSEEMIKQQVQMSIPKFVVILCTLLIIVFGLYNRPLYLAAELAFR